MLSTTLRASTIPHEFKSFDYGIEDLVEILTPPEQILLVNRLLLTDKYGKNMNIRNGSRVTANQPLEFSQTFWFTGGCRIFGIGSEDTATIESYLQGMINTQTPFKTIVRNYGQLYGGGGKK